MALSCTFNPDDLLERTGQDRAFATELIDLFLPQSPRLLDDIRRAASADDGVALASAAHALRGCLATLSATQALKTAALLEAMGRERNMEGASQTCDTLRCELDGLHSDLSAFAHEAQS
jgi:HPt (histidine-containing phosphotransfer) domain-containing protein